MPSVARKSGPPGDRDESGLDRNDVTMGRDLRVGNIPPSLPAARNRPNPNSNPHGFIATLASGARAVGVRASVAKANKLLVFRGAREGEKEGRTMATCLTRQKSEMRVEWMSAVQCSSQMIIRKNTLRSASNY